MTDLGILSEPRFIPALPNRATGYGRMAEARKHVDALRGRPKTWAAIGEFEKLHQAGNVSTGVRNGSFGPRDHWETAIRRNPDTKKYVLYARYIGPVNPRPAAPAVVKPAAPAFATCNCTHTQRRHVDASGPCEAANCDCIEFDPTP